MSTPQLPHVARGSIALLLFLCLFFDFVATVTSEWGLTVLRYSGIDNSEEFRQLGLWTDLTTDANVEHLAAHQRAGRAFAVLSIICVTVAAASFAVDQFASRRLIGEKVGAKLAYATTAGICGAICFHLLLWPVMAGLQSRWSAAILSGSSRADASAASGLGYSFALALLANLGLCAGLPSTIVLRRLEAGKFDGVAESVSNAADSASGVLAATATATATASSDSDSKRRKRDLDDNVRFSASRDSQPNDEHTLENEAMRRQLQEDSPLRHSRRPTPDNGERQRAEDEVGKENGELQCGREEEMEMKEAEVQKGEENMANEGEDEDEEEDAMDAEAEQTPDEANVMAYALMQRRNVEIVTAEEARAAQVT